MNFKTRPSAITTVKAVQEFVPRIFITSEALTKMGIYVDKCADEIGWLGTAYKDDASNTITIDDVYLFDQDVHGATTEITPEGLSDFAEELLAQGDAGIEIWNNLKMWGHSHVNMGVTPSGQDDLQMKTFKDGGHDWFIRLIANKKGEMKLDIYDYNAGVAYIDVPWMELLSEEERAIQNRIDLLYAELDLLQAERDKAYGDAIQAEMKEKVHKIVTTTTSTYKNQSSYGHYVNGKWVYKDDEDEKKTHGQVQTTQKEEKETKVTGGTGKATTIDWEGIEDVLENDESVLEHFTSMELLTFSDFRTFDELIDELDVYGYMDYFSLNDIERIFRVAKKIAQRMGLQ